MVVKKAALKKAAFVCYVRLARNSGSDYLNDIDDHREYAQNDERYPRPFLELAFYAAALVLAEEGLAGRRDALNTVGIALLEENYHDGYDGGYKQKRHKY